MKNNPQNISILLAFAALAAILTLKLFPALIAFMVGRLLAHFLSGQTERTKSKFLVTNAQMIGISIAFVCAIAVSIGIFLEGYVAFRSIGRNQDALLTSISSILDQVRTALPAVISAYLPDGEQGLRAWIINELKEQMGTLASMSKSGLGSYFFLLVGFLIGALSIKTSCKPPSTAPMGVALKSRFRAFDQTFRGIMLAQLWIATFNTLMTTVYLYGILPTFDLKVPFREWLVFLTFFAGLIPILGGVICNAVIVAVVATISFPAAIASLGYLVAIHKTEYLITAKVLGSRSSIAAWQLLAAMFILESIVGVIGLIAGPLLYAYFSKELRDAEIL